MSANPITLPPIPGPIPALPQGSNHDQQMAHHAAQMRRWEAEVAVLRFEQAERSIAAHQRLADVQTRTATAMERTLSEGIPTDQPMVDAINALRAAIAAAGGAPGQAPAVGDVDRMVALVSTMTSAQRQNPAAAAAAAQLAAVRGQG